MRVLYDFSSLLTLNYEIRQSLSLKFVRLLLVQIDFLTDIIVVFIECEISIDSLLCEDIRDIANFLLNITHL